MSGTDSRPHCSLLAASGDLAGLSSGADPKSCASRLGVARHGGDGGAFPFAGAAACPLCYGLDRFGDNGFIERTASPQQRGHVADVLEEGRNRVAAFYGSADTEPRVLVCVSDDCYRRIGGVGSRGTVLFDVALQLSPKGIDPVIAAHELSHIELRHRLGRLRFLIGAIPAWFDEGVAVVVSDDRRYLAPADAPQRCLVRSDEKLPTGKFEWIREVGRFDKKQLYAKAACRVAEWMATKGGAAAVMRLVARVSSRSPLPRRTRRSSNPGPQCGRSSTGRSLRRLSNGGGLVDRDA